MGITSSPSTPLVSIVVLNYKRLSALEQTLKSAVAQRYPSKEMIVVDNHSEEDVATVVRRYGANIQLIELETNVGSCAGRNAGIRAAHGDIVITLDNDVSFLAPDAVDIVVRLFHEHPEYHVLAFQLRDAETGQVRLREWCHPKDWRQFAEKSFATHFFVEGAAAYQRQVFECAGLFYEPLFIYHEGWDLGLRILDRGYRIRYTPEVGVRHLMSPEARSSRPYFLFTRNYIWIAYRDYPKWLALKFLAFRLAMMAYFAARTRNLWSFFRGVSAGVLGCRHIARDPVQSSTLAYIDSLDSERPSFFRRLARHRTAPQL